MAAPISPALFDQFARGWRGYVLIGLIALLSGVFGVARVPPMDIDESRFAQATRQMVETGDYVRIRLQDAERNRKPIGIHWLQAASVNLFDPFTERLNTLWPYRAPSVLGLMLAALATFWGGTPLLGARTALMGAALFAVGLLAGIEGMTAKTDAALVGFTTLAMAALARLRADGSAPRRHALLFWGALAAGVLIKGPVTPMVAGLTLGALWVWERKAAWMKPLLWWPGPVLAAAMAAPWLIAIGVVTQGRFYTELLATELGPKIVGSDHAHGGVPGYYLIFLPLLVFPATYALPAAARVSWRALRAPRADPDHGGVRFLIAWAATTFLMFELLPAKLMHYTLPAYPAIALVCACGMMTMRGRRWRTSHPIGAVMFAVIGAVMVALMAYVATFIPGGGDAGLRRAIATGLIGAAIIIAAVVALSVWRRPTARAAVLVASALALTFGLREQLLPQARNLFVSAETVSALTRTRLLPRADRAFWVVGYSQPSLVFLTRTSIRLAGVEEAAANARSGDTMIIEGRVLQQASAELIAHDLVFVPAEPPTRGVALGRGEWMTLYVGRVEPAPGLTGATEDAPRRTP